MPDNAKGALCAECHHSLGRHDRKALAWPINADPFACTVWGCHCPRFKEAA